MTKSPSFYQVVYQVQGELQSKGIKPIKESSTMALDTANSAFESDLKLCQIRLGLVDGVKDSITIVQD